MYEIATGILFLVFIPSSFYPAQDKSQSAPEFYLYGIGNSHTWDFRPSSDFLEIRKAMHIEIKNGWHINCGQNLKTIWDDPLQTCVELSEFGAYRNAIEHHKWDAITIQTFVGGMGREEKKAVVELFNFIASSINRDFDAYHVSDQWPSDKELTSEQKDVIRKIISEVLDF
jgi:hypothetical protein